MCDTSKKICQTNKTMSCEHCLEKCFMIHPKAEFWDIDRNEKTPLEVSLTSATKFWFICDKCNHSFESTVNQVSNGSWCPYCRNLKRCSSDEVFECSYCLEKCFMSHGKSEFWD